MLFMFHCYRGTAPILQGDNTEEEGQPADAEEEAEVGLQLVPLLLIGWKSVVWFHLSHFVCFPFTEPGLRTNTGFLFNAHAERTASRP